MCSRVVANYMMSKAALGLAPLLSSNVQDMLNSMDHAMSGTETAVPRWRTCLYTVSK